MMSSASSTKRGPSASASTLRPWHLYFILAMVGATWAVIASRQTQPAALLLLSAAILAAGLAGAAMHSALMGFFGASVRERAPLALYAREELLREKALLLRSLKELEFDRSMSKISDADAEEVGGRLRARAIAIMEQLDGDEGARVPAPEIAVSSPAPAAMVGRCASCETQNDPDARFCKHCGARLL